MTYPALHACLACGRHPSTHAPAGPDSDDACPMCGLGDERETERVATPTDPGCPHTSRPGAVCSDCGWLPKV